MKIAWIPFWLGVACLFGIVLYFDYQRFVMPDALSTAFGAVGGTMIGAWILWRLIKFGLPKIAPDAKVFVLVFSCLVLGTQLLQQ